MARHDYRIGESSRVTIQLFRDLPLRDPRRVALLSLLVALTEDPNGVPFEQDELGLRFTYLDNLAVVWKLDIPSRVIEIVAIREDR